MKIFKFYKMPRSTISGMVRRLKNKSSTMKQQGRPLKLSDRGKGCIQEVRVKDLLQIITYDICYFQYVHWIEFE